MFNNALLLLIHTRNHFPTENYCKRLCEVIYVTQKILGIKDRIIYCIRKACGMNVVYKRMKHFVTLNESD